MQKQFSNKGLVISIIVLFAIAIIFTIAAKQINKNKQTAESQGNISNTSVGNQPIVTLGPSGFSPKIITIKKGTILAWINKSGKTATINSFYYPNNLLYPFLNLGQFQNGLSIQTVFKNPGKFQYYNYDNRSQTGTIIVQ